MRTPLYLIAMIVAIMNAPTNIYDVHCRGLGTVEAEPWRRKSSGLAARAVSLFARFLAFAWPHRQRIAAVACALLVLLLAPNAHGLSICIVGHTVTQLESDLKAKQAAVKTLIESQMKICAEHVVKPAAGDQPAILGRLRTDEEKAAVQAILDEAKGIKGRLDGTKNDAALLAEIDRLTENVGGGAPPRQTARDHAASFGAQFVAAPAIRDFIKAGGHQTQGLWTSPAVELQGTLLDTSGGSGGPLIVPDYRPGVLPLLYRRTVVADLIASGSTDSNAIIYMKELAATNAAAAVAEGIAKPESALSFVQATDPVVKIATWIPATTEMLEDFPAMQSMIDARLRMFLTIAEEDQLLNGSGVAPNMRGIMNRLALAAAVVRGADSNADAIFKQISAIATNALIQPDAWVMNPLNWLTIQLTKNAAGNYLGTGPWAAAQQPALWGIPGAITPAIVANTALVGAFATCAQFFRKGGVKAAMSNSHLGYFVENKVAILIEERGALAVYREAAFGKVTGLA